MKAMNEREKMIVDALRFNDCIGTHCTECVCNEWCDGGTRSLQEEAANLIERLSEELERVKRERDAAVQELADLEVLISPSAEMCSICKYAHCEFEVEPCASCKPSYERSKWEWRGVCAENSGGMKNE